MKKDKIVRANIKKLRKQAGLTQDQLAAKLQVVDCDLSRATIANIEAGRRHVYPHEIRALAKALRVTYQDIIDA